MKNSFSFFIFLLFVNTMHGQFNPETVTIGTQVWMSKNLDVATYRNGDPIPNITDDSTWGTLTTGAWCYYKNDSARYAPSYGKLYNWYAVNDPRGLALAGWHIPSEAEWTKLSTYLGDHEIAGAAMKEKGKIHWHRPNIKANNSSGFTALPGGWRDGIGRFSRMGFIGTWWTSTKNTENSSNVAWKYGVNFAWVRQLEYLNGYLTNTILNKKDGYSVRCVRD